jgi:hypothetical protein
MGAGYDAEFNHKPMSADRQRAVYGGLAPKARHALEIPNYNLPGF